MTGEWTLIGFTLLTQMAVGVFLLLGLVHFGVSRLAGREAADRMSGPALLAVGPVLGLALLASIIHLGYPAHALNAVNNIGSSWLSREIVSFSLFAAVGGVFALLQWRRLGPPAVRRILAWTAAGLGLVLVYAMARVYLLRSVPPWNTWLTPAAFFTTTFLLGALALGLAFVLNHRFAGAATLAAHPDIRAENAMLRPAIRWLVFITLALLGVELIVIPLQLSHLTLVDAVGQLGLAETLSRLQWMLGLRLSLAFLGAILFVRLLHRLAAGDRYGRLVELSLLACALVVAAEILGRYLFYALYARSGL
ncbi:MAG: dimethyl sulfoxide reductase anchor subunit [Acidobacteria bacterium]|nr:dimethyl sulfoxide reductase anchor subunit [Acidobacteriota bacterium]